MTDFENFQKNFERDFVVAKTQVNDEQMVSTVMLPFDHGYDGTPLLFETMIFGGEHGGYQRRYSTREEAVAGHNEICIALADGEPLDEEE